MIYEGVNFNESVIKRMTEDEFESKHLDLLWSRYDIETRKKMLGHVYSLINKPARRQAKAN